MAVNKVVINDEIKIDLTSDTVSPDTLSKGITAHDKSGNVIVGTMEGSSAPSVPYMSYTITPDGNGYQTIDIHGDSTNPLFKGMISNYNNITSISISGSKQIPESFMINVSKVENIIIGDGVEEIKRYAFETSSNSVLQKIVISDSVKIIGASTFKRLTNYKTPAKFIFGKNLEKLEGNSFVFNRGVYDFRRAVKIPQMINSFAGRTSSFLSTFIVPDELYDQWKVATNWAKFSPYFKKASEVTE